MAARKKDTTLEIITETAEEQPVKTASAGSDMTFVACALPLGIIYDDVDNGAGGFKTVTFPGVNHALAGKKTGILLGKGNAVLVSIAKKDWEDIKKKHGRERYFVNVPAQLFEVEGGESEFKSRRDEISEIDNGVNPVDPKSTGTEAAVSKD